MVAAREHTSNRRTNDVREESPCEEGEPEGHREEGDEALQEGRTSKNGKLSAIDAAAKALGESKESMNTRAMIEAMAKKGYWTSPGGKTRWATLYSAILNVTTKGKESRFKKTDRGHIALNK